MTSTCDGIKASWMKTNKEFNFSVGRDNESRLKGLFSRWDESLSVIINEIAASSNNVNLLKGGKIESWFHRIVDCHSDIDRHYHTLCHLEEVFGYVDILLDQELENNQVEFVERGDNDSPRTSSNVSSIYKAIITLSIFFHDAVYNPKSVTNEEDSAELFQQFIRDLFTTTAAATTTTTDGHREDEGNAVEKTVIHWYGFELVKKFILATKSHSPDDMDILQHEKIYLDIFLDADMSVLGKSLEAYLHYASLIRREYAHIPRNIYCQKRADILRSFLGNAVAERTKTIFVNKAMRDALEATAIQNLQYEIEVLDKGLIPGEDDIKI